jgi:hypothetical protein
MIVFAAAVIVFARFFRTGLWGLVTRPKPEETAAPGAAGAKP